MDVKKRIRADLCELRALKKQEQEAQSILIVEVAFLREEKEKLSKEIQTEKESYQGSIDSLKQEISFLKSNRGQLEENIQNLTKASDATEAHISENQRLILGLQESVQSLTISESLYKTLAREYLDKLNNIKDEYEKQQMLNSDKNLELRFLQGKILLAESGLSKLKANAQEAQKKLELLIKEQSRHSQWDEYLQDKESFLIEQFKLLGVKYVVYNSK